MPIGKNNTITKHGLMENDDTIDESKPSISINRLQVKSNNTPRPSSYMMRRPQTKRSIRQRSRSHGNINGSNLESDFVFQQPAYDPHIIRRHALDGQGEGGIRKWLYM